MFRRKLKKEKSKYRVKLFILILLLLTLLVVSGEYLFLNFSFGRANFISPVAKEPKFKSSPSGPSDSLSNLLNKNKVFYSAINNDSDGSFAVTLQDGGEVILSSKKDIGSQLTSLQLVLSRLTIEGKKLKRLDFRFDNPVVEF